VSLRAARALTVGYFVLALIFVTWPGLVPFARIRPLVLGLPFSMAWIASWVAGSAVVLYLLDRVEGRHRARPPGRRAEGDPGAGPRGEAGRARLEERD